MDLYFLLFAAPSVYFSLDVRNVRGQIFPLPLTIRCTSLVFSAVISCVYFFHIGLFALTTVGESHINEIISYLL